jgi:predicted transcriptional regulator
MIDELSTPRSTVDRDVRILEREGFVERTGDGYRTTAVGRAAMAVSRSFLDAFEDVQRAGEVLSVLSADVTVSPDVFSGATVVEPTEGAPDRPLLTLRDVVDGADSVMGFSPVGLVEHVELFHELITDQAADAEFVLEPSVISYLVEEHGEKLREAFDTGRLTLYETPDTAYGLTLVRRGDDRRIVLTTYSRNGMNGMIINDTAAAWQWGRRTYLSYRQADRCRRIYGDGVAAPDE